MPKDLQVDKFWGFMGRKKVAGERIFSNLVASMKSFQCIPHLNASGERTFSMVRKIVNENRTSCTMTLCSVYALLSCKLNCDRSAGGFIPSKVELHVIKKAT